MCITLFFFFKQKTAYEMRISDWSSDVCSSDLKVVVMGTIALNLAGFAVIWALEFNNPDTLANLPWHGPALAAWMQSVNSRTVGYVTLDITQLHESSTLIIMLIMFIGGGSLSKASGIKVGTFIILQIGRAHV